VVWVLTPPAKENALDMLLDKTLPMAPVSLWVSENLNAGGDVGLDHM